MAHAGHQEETMPFASLPLDIHTKIKELLVHERLDYVLVTCRKVPEKSSENQKMEVELSFEGDPALASYLVHGAQEYFDETCTFHEDT